MNNPNPAKLRTTGGFIRIRFGEPNIVFSNEICQFVALLPKMIQYRREYGDNGLSTEIIKYIMREMKTGAITQEIVNQFSAKMGLDSSRI